MRLRNALSCSSESGTMSSPSTRISPASGFSRPSMSFNSTDLPEPVTPSRITVPPAATLNDTSPSTRFSSKLRDTLRSSIATGALPSTICHLPYLGKSNPNQELGDEKVEHQDEDRGHHHRLGRRAAHALGAAARMQAAVATHQSDNEGEADGLDEPLSDVLVSERLVGRAPVFGAGQMH